MNVETKKIRDELKYQTCKKYLDEWTSRQTMFYNGTTKIMSDNFNPGFDAGFDAGHATAMKDVGELINALEVIVAKERTSPGVEIIQIIAREALDRFTQTQTEKIEGE